MNDKHYKVRTYVVKGKEYIEVLSRNKEQDKIIWRYWGSLGESLVTFEDCDFVKVLESAFREFSAFSESIAKEMNSAVYWERILGRTQHLPSFSHPYFCFAMKRFFDSYESKSIPQVDDVRTELLADFERIVADQKVLLNSKFFRTDKGNTSSSFQPLGNDVFLVDHFFGTGIEYVPQLEEEKMIVPRLWTEATLQEYDAVLAEVFYPQSAIELYGYLKTRCLLQQAKIRVCKNCGKHFVADTSGGAEYCKREVPGTKRTCRQVGATRLYLNRSQEKPGVKLYNRAYKTRNARIRYGSMTKHEFQEWAKQARVERDRCIKGEITEAQFEQWLAESH